MYFVFVYMDWILSSHAVTSFLFASYKMIFSFYKVEVLSIGRSQRTCFSLLWGLLRFRLRKLSVWTIHFHRMLDLAGDWLFSIINDIQIWWEDEIAYVYISHLAREQSLLLKIYWYYMNSFILRRSWQSFNFNWKLWSVSVFATPLTTLWHFTKIVLPERVGLPPLVLPLLGLVVAQTPLGCGLRLWHGGHVSVHIVHTRPDLFNIWHTNIFFLFCKLCQIFLISMYLFPP